MSSPGPSDAITLLGTAFGQWAEPWTRLGLWVSLWSEDARCIEVAPRDVPFWEFVTARSGPFQRLLAETARAATPGDACPLPHVAGGVAIIAIPLQPRLRKLGTLLACALTDEFADSSSLTRFCARHELDRELVARAAAAIPMHSTPTVTAYASILTQALHTFSAGALATREVSDLATHLARAYEELNLLYRVSANLSILRTPSLHLERLCEELVGATAIESAVAVLEPPDGASAPPTVISAGRRPASDEDLLHLYAEARRMPTNAGAALILNKATEDPLTAWAAGWLRQFMFAPLEREGRHFGGLLAINHPGQSDFGSEEVQLVSALAERSSAFLENVRLYADLEQLFMGLMHALVSSIDAKDPYTSGHSQRVAWLSRHLAALAGIDGAPGERVYLSGLLHDVGKIGISEGVLRKTGRLTPAEFDEMKRHPAIGARILSGVRQVEDIIPGVLCHHERIDGRGYPNGLKGDEIPFLGRIIGLADSFDAITTSRTYRAARSVSVAAEEIRNCAGSQFDRHLVDLLLAQDLEDLHHRMTMSIVQPVGHSGSLPSALHSGA